MEWTTTDALWLASPGSARCVAAAARYGFENRHWQERWSSINYDYWQKRNLLRTSTQSPCLQ